MEQKKKAVIYCRVSTKEQVEEGNSLNTQEKICKEYALKYGYEISRVFIELGESAKTADRTELKKLLVFCTSKKEKISVLIIYRIDRLSRQLEDYTVIKSKLKQSGVEIKSTAEYFEDNPAGRFMENIIANVAQFDNDVRTERSINGMRDAVREGRYVWFAPYGYSNGRLNNKPNIIPNQYALVVREAFELVARDNMPVEHVRQYLNDKWIKKANIHPPSKSQFPQMLRNELYTGWVNKFGERHKGIFEPIITEALFIKVQNAIAGRKIKKMGYVTDNPDFPLRKFFFHPTGLKLTGAWSQGNKKKYPYYFFRIPKNIYQKEQLEKVFSELLDGFTLPAKYYVKLAKGIHEELAYTQENEHKSKLIYLQQIDLLKQKQQILIQKNIDGILTDIILKQQLDIVGKDLVALEDIIQQPTKEVINYDSILADIREFVEHPSKTWEKAYFKGKIQLQWLYFPKGVVFDGKICRTPEICNIFKLKGFFDTTNSYDVRHVIKKANSRHIPLSPSYSKNTQAEYSILWKKIGEELKVFYGIKQKMDRNGDNELKWEMEEQLKKEASL